MTAKECYRILGVAGTANTEDVKHAYRRRAFELHPDLNPHLADASRQFQLLNEAYVVLMRVLSEKEAKTATAGTGGKKERAARPESAAHEPGPSAKREADPSAKRGSDQDAKHEPGPSAKRESDHDAPGAPGHEDAQETAGHRAAQAEHTSSTAGQAAGAAAGQAAGENPASEAEARKRRMADSAYAQQEDVLRDILDDQFARRVFEDIYREVNKQQAVREDENKPDGIAPPPPKANKPNLEWGDKFLNLDFTGGLGGMMRGWLRQQIDDTLAVQLPKGKLFPGARVRLQIRQGLKNELHVVEVVLPQDFRIGKAIRLKGLGRKVGKWTGDLYLTIEAQQ